MEDFDGINKGTFQVNGNYAVGDGAAIDVSNKKTINNTFNDNTTNRGYPYRNLNRSRT